MRRIKEQNAGRRSQRGFTLVELMVAMVVLSMGLFSVLQLQIISVRGNGYARERTEAYELAQAVAQEITTRSLAWQSGIAELSDALPDILPADSPDDTANLDLGDLRSLRTFHGLTIANDDTASGAIPVNVRGIPFDESTNSLGAIYCIHYIAHPARMSPGEIPTSELLRVTILVSWDNRDHGLGTTWGQCYPDDGSYFQRHLVTVTAFLQQTRTN